MHTLEIRLEGEFYDSYLYKGRLYLWRLDQTIVVLNWDDLISSFEVDDADNLALECAFRRSSLLYKSDISHVLNDDELRPVVVEKFNRLGQHSRELQTADWSEFLVRELDNAHAFPHADINIYMNQLFVGNSEGLWFGDLMRTKAKRRTSQDLERRWDAPCFDVAIYNRLMAVASGSEGAFQMSVDEGEVWQGIGKEPKQLTTAHASAVEWMYGSVFCSSDEGGALIEYSPYEGKKEFARDYRETLDVDDIFDDQLHGWYVWGARDKICAAFDEQIAVARYSPYSKGHDGRIDKLGVFDAGEHLVGRPVRADSSYFGFVVELDAGLLILGSNEDTLWVPGEPVNWRLFPGSTDYVNQLHIQWEDHLSVLSFNDDYLIDQKTKAIGLSFPRFRAQAGSRGYSQ
ncbi:MAG: hypothetical protein CNCCGFBP_00216 [Fimbriimonadaceae bacterium]|nr:hypothetical protein [Fimbriimonadaceae bacterium]